MHLSHSIIVFYDNEFKIRVEGESTSGRAQHGALMMCSMKYRRGIYYVKAQRVLKISERIMRLKIIYGPDEKQCKLYSLYYFPESSRARSVYLAIFFASSFSHRGAFSLPYFLREALALRSAAAVRDVIYRGIYSILIPR